jgi:hypothetical protein
MEKRRPPVEAAFRYQIDAGSARTGTLALLLLRAFLLLLLMPRLILARRAGLTILVIGLVLLLALAALLALVGVHIEPPFMVPGIGRGNRINLAAKSVDPAVALTWEGGAPWQEIICTSPGIYKKYILYNPHIDVGSANNNNGKWKIKFLTLWNSIRYMQFGQ